MWLNKVDSGSERASQVIQVHCREFIDISALDHIRFDFCPSPCEKVVIVPNTNCITSAIRKFMMEIPSPSSRGGEGHSYIVEDMDVRQGLSNPYPLQTNISAKFWTLCRQMAENFLKCIP